MGAPVKLALTYEDYALLPDDGKRYEILDGELFVTPAPSTKHQRVLGNLHLLLGVFVRQSGVGDVLLAPCDVLLATHDIVQPDLLFVAREHAGRIETANVKGAPDLLVEVLSPTTRRVDERTKRDRYRATGVAEYWLVDPELETIKVYRWTAAPAAGPVEPKLYELERGDVLATPLLPGLELSLSAVFEH
jgi:Uma2 family endonuclease